MHFLLLILSLLLLQPFSQNMTDLQGYWSGAIEIQEQKLNINITFSYSDGELDGSLNIPEQNAYNLPVEVVDFDDNAITFQFQTGTGAAVFHGRFNEKESVISGNFEQLGNLFPFSLRKRSLINGVRSDLPEQELIINSRGGRISGSLILTHPGSPIVVLLSGSGSQDRDETVAGFRVFGTLSAELYRNGYASFRFDDRGIGQSEGEPDASLHELAGDLTEVLNYLKLNYGDRFSGFILLGHS